MDNRTETSSNIATRAQLAQLPVDRTCVEHARGTSSDRRVFVPEAHMPRSRRLMLDTSAVELEVGVGVRHRFEWHACDAVLRFPDRVELVYGASSVVIRTSEWLHGDAILNICDTVVPSGLLIDVAAEPEADAGTYHLAGLARSSAVVLGLAAFACICVGLLALIIGAADKRTTAVVIGLLFLIPVRPLVLAIRRRLAVPRRWRAVAAISPAARVRADGVIAGASARMLWTGISTAPVASIVLAVAWWKWTGFVPVVFVVLGVALSSYLYVEVQRRRHR